MRKQYFLHCRGLKRALWWYKFIHSTPVNLDLVLHFDTNSKCTILTIEQKNCRKLKGYKKYWKDFYTQVKVSYKRHLFLTFKNTFSLEPRSARYCIAPDMDPANILSCPLFKPRNAVSKQWRFNSKGEFLLKKKNFFVFLQKFLFPATVNYYSYRQWWNAMVNIFFSLYTPSMG